jgi:hypothetical protein
LRESRTVTIDGVRQSWRIVWRGKPKSECGPEQSWNCPCRAFFYGERGSAELVRSRPGHPDETLSLAEAFISNGDWGIGYAGESILQRWLRNDGDGEIEDRKALARSVRARPSVPLMEFRDYNHDGWAAEFLLPVDTSGCADLRAVVIGVTRRQNRLHVFSSAAAPDHPLFLQPGAWQALLSGRDATPVTSVEVACGFRGAGSQSEVELTTIDGGIFATWLGYDCN